MRRISKDIIKRNEIACSSTSYTRFCFLCPYVFYVLILPWDWARPFSASHSPSSSGGV